MVIGKKYQGKKTTKKKQDKKDKNTTEKITIFKNFKYNINNYAHIILRYDNIINL